MEPYWVDRNEDEYDEDFDDDLYADVGYADEYEMATDHATTRSSANPNYLSHVTCGFCTDIIAYAMKFRSIDEEEFPDHHPTFHMEKEDTRGDLIERAKTCKICAMALSATNDLRSAQSSERARVDPNRDPYESEVWWEFARPGSRFIRPMLCVVDEGYGSAMFKFRETPSVFLESFTPVTTESVNQSKYVSYRVLRRWYDKCLDHGGTLQSLFLINDLQSTTIRLIDVENECLCDVPTSEAYIALSYVWGRLQDSSDKLTTGNIQRLYAPHGITRHLSLARTVRDAIEVTKELKFRYLFVDRLCIIQDSSEDKALYVDAMHEIYNKARITVVAAAGADAQAGLPGTRGTPRTQNRLYHPRQSVNIDSTRDLVRVYKDEFPPADLVEQHLQNSVWATRGWTFQEEKLSERMLIFTDQAVLWKCAHICLYEDCAHDQHEHLSQNLMDMQASDAFGRDAFWWGRKKDTNLTINGRQADFAGLTGHDDPEFKRDTYVEKRDKWISSIFRLRIQEYCERQLTYQDDVARAFNGMIGAFNIVYEPLPVHHGMLTRSLPSEMTWACMGCVDGSHESQEDHRGLRSTTNTGAQSVSLFPTWSWHAWQNQPAWIHNKRLPKQSMREMEQAIAMTTSMYAGVSNPPSIALIYRETRPVEWGLDKGDFAPALWMTQHSLHANALMFMALAYRAYRPLGRQPADLLRMTDLGLRLPQSYDVSIVEWLQRPPKAAFERPMGLICLSYFDETDRQGASVARMAAMLLVSYRLVEGKDIAFREGLFTCEVASFTNARKFFRPQPIFLC